VYQQKPTARREPMKRWAIATPTAAVVLAGSILTGCSAGGSGSAATSSQAAAPATAAPAANKAVGRIPDDVRFPMSAGNYATVQFRPRFTFSTTVTAGGGADAPDVANFSLKVYRDASFAAFYFLRFAQVCDPKAPSQLTAPPQRLLDCLVHNPHLRVTAKPAPVTIGGMPGQRLDVQVVGKLPGPPSCNGDPHPCVRMGTTPDFAPTLDGGFGAAFEAGDSARIWLFDVHGAPVAVAWSDLTAHFASNLAAAEKIMETVRFT
jgi:hypothetical protein